MSGHTPGPWYAEIRNGSASILRRPPSELYENGGGVAGEKSIATVSRGWYHEGSEGFPFEANARLIAAAPELLEALTRLRDCYSTSHSPSTRQSCWDQAIAAIAKATGAAARAASDTTTPERCSFTAIADQRAEGEDEAL